MTSILNFFSFFALAVGLLLIVTTTTEAADFSIHQANTSVWLSAAAYCGKDSYMTHVFKGPTAGFSTKYVIYDQLSDTQGYIGYLESDHSIYVVYRGSSSINNWLTNLDTVKTAYSSYPDCNCQVHAGFYHAEQKVITDVISHVKSLRAVYPTATVKVTGHSLGAALAQLTSMDLLKAGITTDALYTFGQPRIGDANYASLATGKLSTWRVVHNADIVPHVPATTGMDFVHSCREEFEDVNHNLKTCDATCEDATCGDQYKISQCTVDDHLLYLNLDMGCSAVSA
jgi:Lipase (class 3)